MWSDKESDSDYLNFGEVSQLAIDVLTADGMLPVSIGVFGSWGSGKSSLLKLISAGLAEDEREWVVVKFDAWLYQGYDDARASLLEAIATALTEAAEGNEKLLHKARGLLARVDGFRALGLIAEGATLLAGVPTGGLLSRSVAAAKDAVDGVQTPEEFQSLGGLSKDVRKEVGGLIRPAADKSPPKQIDEFRKEYSEVLNELDKPLVVVIDNLDRCLPANAIDTLEAIRLFLFLPKTAFIVAADEEMIRTSVAVHFKGASDRHQIDYLDKLIQVPIRVPKSGVREVRAYLFMLYARDFGLPVQRLEALRVGLERSLQESWKEDAISRQDALKLSGENEHSELDEAFSRADRIAPILSNSPMIHGNPRVVKRLLNVVKMRSQVAERRDMPLDEATITKLVIFERCMGVLATTEFYRLVDQENGTPTLITRLEGEDGVDDIDLPQVWEENQATKKFLVEWARLEPKLSGVDLRPAIYLSRETLPIGSSVAALSAQAKECLEILVKTQSASSPTANKAIETLTTDDYVPVMEGIVNKLRQVSDWTKSPEGFTGACLLAGRSQDVAEMLVRFLQQIETDGNRPPWLTARLKDQPWYKDQ